MASSTELLTDLADIDGISFGAHAHADFAIRQFFKKDGNDNALDGAQVIDQPLVILGKNGEFCGCFQSEPKTCDATFFLETHGTQQFAQKLQTSTGIILVELLTQSSYGETGANEFCRDLERVSAGLWILKRAGIS